MIEQLHGASEENGTGQGPATNTPCLTEHLHRLAAYGALAVIAAIVFGTGALRL